MLHSIAYAAEEPVLITFEDALLVAYDVVDRTLKWRLELPRPVASVVFGAPNAIGLAAATSPWRSGLSGSTAIAVDVDGGAHIIDAVTGALAQSHPGVGAPVSVASAVDAFAIATKDRVYVWREGARTEHEIRATAIAFSNDGAELAMGTKAGALTIIAGEKHTEDAIRATIYALAWNPCTGWLAGTDRGIYDSRNDQFVLEGRVRGLAIDRPGVQVAVPRGDQSVQVVSWPATTALPTRVMVRGRGVRGLAFGPKNRLGIALNRGDACVVNVGKRTSRALSRALPAWKVTVELEVLKPQLAPPPPPDPPMKWKLGFGGFGAVAIGARLLFALIRTSSYSSTPSYIPPPDISALTGCDTSCERGRLNDLVETCNRSPLADCASEAVAARNSFDDGDCDGTGRSIAAIDAKNANGSAPGTSSAFISALLAKTGLATSCPRPIPDGLTRLKSNGDALLPEHVDLPTLEDEAPFDVYSPRTGTVFVTSVDHEGKTCRVYHSAGQPFKADTTIDDCTSAKLFGRGDDVYAAMGRWLGHFSNGVWTTVATSTSAVLQIAGAPEPGGEIFVTTADNHLLRARDGKLTSAPLPQSNLVLGSMAYSGDTLLLDAIDKSKHVLLRRGSDGRWLTTKGRSASEPLFGGPNGLVITGRDATELDVSTDKGATWKPQQPLPFRIDTIWARSGSEIYAGGSRGIVRLVDGGWARTSFGGPVAALSGNDHEIYAIVAHEP